jgi:hypothetical protein
VPRITFFGVARADGTVIEEPNDMSGGVRVYTRPSYGFSLVVEGRPGVPSIPLGTSTINWNPSDPSVLPDLQAIVSNRLGDGSDAVCDDSDDGDKKRGGVPAAAGFVGTQDVANAISDFGCRFKDSFGQPGGRGANDACTRLPDGFDRFWDPTSTVQFCGLIDKPYEFHPGDTLVTVRIRDVERNLSEAEQLIIRVQ